jgi:hypothetical protein
MPTPEPKTFAEAFEAWKQDDRYQIGDDIGWEYSDSLEAGPTPVDCSSTLKNHGQSYSAEEIIDSGQEAFGAVPGAR